MERTSVFSPRVWLMGTVESSRNRPHLQSCHAIVPGRVVAQARSFGSSLMSPLQRLARGWLMRQVNETHQFLDRI